MAKKYVVKWYDWHTGHHKEKGCNGEQLNELFSKLNSKKEISDITITEVNTIELFSGTIGTIPITTKKNIQAKNHEVNTIELYKRI